MVTGGNVRSFYTDGVPVGFYNQLNTLLKGTASVRQLALGMNDSWGIVADTNTCYVSGVPTALYNSLVSIQDSGYTINALALGKATSYAVIYSNSAWYASATRKR